MNNQKPPFIGATYTLRTERSHFNEGTQSARIKTLHSHRSVNSIKNTRLATLTSSRPVKRYGKQSKDAKNNTEPEDTYRLPPDNQREAHMHPHMMCYQDTSDITVSKNFESSEGIGWCFYHHKLYIFGGIGRYFDLNVNTYNPRNHKFSKMKMNEVYASPQGRCFHSMTPVDGKIIMFGGETSNRGFGARFLVSETWVLDLKEKFWTKVKDDQSCEIPARKNHKTCVLGRRVVISGGTVEDDVFSKEFCAYDHVVNSWKTVNTYLPDWEGRVGHSMTSCYRHKLTDLYNKPAKNSLTEGNKVRKDIIYSC